MNTRMSLSVAVKALRLEVAKIRRLRTLPVLLVLVATSVLFGSFGFFGPTGQSIAHTPHAWPWASALMLVTMVNALIHPILVAVITSRQVDIENTGGGWTLNASVGLTPGKVCRAKLVVISCVIAIACALQMGGTVLLGLISSITVPFDLVPWATYFLLLWILDTVLAVIHVLLSARVENQIVSVGVGLLGAFAAMYLLLAPLEVARLVPWGHYAVIATTRMDEASLSGVAYDSPLTGWFLILVALAAVLFFFVTHRMDRIER